MDNQAFIRGFFEEMEKQAALPLIPLAVRAATMLPKVFQGARAAWTALKGSKILSTGSQMLGRASGAMGYGKGFMGKVNLVSDAANIIKSRAQQQTTPSTAEPGAIITP
jgi:hypothetical protein